MFSEFTPNGIKFYKQNDKLLHKFKNKTNKDGSLSVIDKETKEVVLTTNDYWDTQKFHYEEVPVTNIDVLVYLNSWCLIAPGTTIKDILKTIKKNRYLLDFTKILFPHAKNPGKILKTGPITLYKAYFVANDAFIEENNIKADKTEDLTVIIDKQGLLIENKPGKDPKILAKGYVHFTLYDVLDSIIGNFSEKPYLTITKDGIFNENGLVNEFDVPVGSITELAEDLTLGDFFRVISRYPSLCTFISLYANCPYVDDFHKAVNEPPLPSEGINHLEIYKIIKFSKYDCHTDASFHGIGPDVNDLTVLTPLGVSATPIQELSQLPLKLEPTSNIFSYVGRTSGPATFLGGYKVSYTLLEIMEAIYDDLSFYGNPDDARNFIQEMFGRLKDYENGEQNGLSI